MFTGITTTEIVAGFLVLTAGCVLHLISKGILIRNVVLCDRGIYGFVRHPYYLANYLIDSGFCLLSGSPYLLLVYPFLFFWSYGPTVRKEESFLSARHTDAFDQHSATIPQIFPDRTSLKRWKAALEGFGWRRITWKEWARLTRICALGLLLWLIHEIKIDGLKCALIDMLNPTWHDFDEFTLALLSIILLLASIAFREAAKRRRDGTAA